MKRIIITTIVLLVAVISAQAQKFNFLESPIPFVDEEMGLNYKVKAKMGKHASLAFNENLPNNEIVIILNPGDRIREEGYTFNDSDYYKYYVGTYLFESRDIELSIFMYVSIVEIEDKEESDAYAQFALNVITE